jgi:hypothetical protein
MSTATKGGKDDTFLKQQHFGLGNNMAIPS